MRTMNSLFSLMTAIETKQMLGINRQSVDVWIDTGTITAGNYKETENGLHFCDYEYQMALAVDGIHGHRAGLIIAMLKHWHDGLDDDVKRGFSAPQLVTSSATKPNGGGRVVNIEYTLQARDAIYLTRDAAGPVVALGERWTFGDHSLNWAETADLTVGIG